MMRRILGSWGLFLISTIVICTLLEFGSFLIFRIKGIKRYHQEVVTNIYHPYLGWTHSPNAVIDTSNECRGKTVILTDKDGYSITPYASFEEPEFTIAVLGGSAIFGAGVRNNAATVPAYLEKIIVERKDIKAEVYNLAGRGYQSFQQMLMLHRFLRSNKVDLILAVGVRNDVSSAAFHQDMRSAFLDDYAYSVAAFVQRIEKGAVIVAGLAPTVRSKSYTVDLLFRIIEKLRGMPVSGLFGVSELTKGSFENIEERVRVANINFTLMDTLARENESEFIMILQPTIFMKENLKTNEINCIYKDKNIREYVAEYTRRFYDRFRVWPKSYIYYDLSYVLNETGKVYADEGHYNDQGAFMLAKEIFQKIDPVIDKIIQDRKSSLQDGMEAENAQTQRMF